MAPSIVVLGGGIIGSSVAYFLAQAGSPCTLVERSQTVGGASHRAAGFLAGSWGDGQITEGLHRASFAMHKQLANELNVQSFRPIQAYRVETRAHWLQDEANGRVTGQHGYTAGPKIQVKAAHTCHGCPPWLDGDEVASTSLLDSEAAQIDPVELRDALLQSAVSRGTKLVTGEVTGIDTTTSIDDDDNSRRRVSGVRLRDGSVLAADQICVALGPWSCAVEDWLGVPLPLEGVLSSSAIWHQSEAAGFDPAASLFCEEDTRGCHLEVHPRLNGDLYVCGCGGSRVVPASELRAGDMPAEAACVPDMTRIDAARQSLTGLSRVLGRRPPDLAQACMRPCAPDGKPILGPLPGVEGMYIATGHNAWGITWAPATGLAIAQLMLQGDARAINLKPFSPRRFDTRVNRELMRQRGKDRRGEAVGEQW